MNSNKLIKDFVFRGLLLEADTESFRKAGLRIGVDFAETEEKLLFEQIQNFPVESQSNALQMAKLYALVHCFENQIRGFIREILDENIGSGWWTAHAPKKVRDYAQKRLSTAEANSWLEGKNSDNLELINFGHLSDIILENWSHFEALIPSQHWLKQRMDELEVARNYIAHNRMLLDEEFQRIYMYISDWNKQIGL